MFRKLERCRAAVSAGALALVLGAGVAVANPADEPSPVRDTISGSAGVRPSQPIREPREALPPSQTTTTANLIEHGTVTAQAESHGHADSHGQADSHAGHGDHGHGGHDDHHAGPPPPINFWKGLIGAKEGIEEESLLWRRPDTPPPFLATLINFAVFVFVLVRFGAKPLAEGLKKRKETIMRDIDEAQRMREASEKRLEEYKLRLEKIEDELERVRREFREAGERERERIIAEANERRERMKRDAEFLLSQELKQMRQDLLHETVDQALRGAAELLRAKLTPAEQDRYLEALLLQLPARSGSGKGVEAAAAKGGMS